MRAAVLALLLVGCPAPEEPPPDDPTPGVLEADAGTNLQVELGQAVGFDGSGSVGAFEHEWDFGDGFTGGGETTSHTYASPGHYVVVLTVRDEVGRASTDAAVVTVFEPLSPEAISNASTLVGDGSTFWVVLPDFDLVAVVDRASAEVTDHLPVCVKPRSLALHDGALVVACSGDDAVEIWSTAKGTRTQRIEFAPGSAPYGAVMTDPGRIDVLLRGTGEVVRVELANGLPVLEGTLPDVRGAAAVADRTLAVRFRSNDTVGEVWDSAGPIIELPRDPGPDSDTGARGVPTYLHRIAISPSGTRAAVVGLQANVERGLWREGQPLTHETTARATLRLVDLATGTQSARRSFDDRDMASAVAWSPLGDWIYVAMHGMETVEVLDAWTFELTGAFLNVGRGPDGLWADDEAVWVSCALSRELVAYPITELGSPQQELARIDLRPASGEVLDAQVLLGKQIFHRSADPRMTKDGYVSCGSCHFDGDSDNRTWDFTDRGEGLRNTISLLGRGGSVPIHWTGNFDEVQDFENDVRGPQQGAGFLSDEDWEETSDTFGPAKAGRSADLDALAAYVESLTEPPHSPGADLDVSAGLALFEDPTVGCADCHAAPGYSDSQFLAPGQPLLHDVGTLTDASGQRLGEELLGIDTPHLFGLWASAPYLHDGSAATLRDVLITRNPADLHGVTSTLTEQQLSDLEAFLRSL